MNKLESEFGDDLPPAIKERIGWLPRLSAAAISRLPWPVELESTFSKLLGRENCHRSWNGILMSEQILVGRQRTRFTSALGSAWMDTPTRDGLLQSLSHDQYQTPHSRSGMDSNIVVDLRRELTQEVNFPGKYGDQWEKALEERAGWSLENAYEEAFLKGLGPTIDTRVK
ncbi:MAG: hypothetical protein R3F13_14090 [Prosthecobacter sp.]